MYELLDTVKVEKIDTITMYRMIYELLRIDFYYEAKCLVDIFIEKRIDRKELELLNEVKGLLFEYKIEEVKQIIKNFGII